jgi:type II secretory pathway pseudopilin PulG
MAEMVRPTVAGRRQRGVIYLALMILIATLGAGLAATATVWHQVQQRAREQELLFIGQQYLRAIQQYYEAAAGGNRYPPSLEALLLDERTPSIRRYLRRPYRDPLGNTLEWGLVQAPQGGIMGIYSMAPGEPIKKANFPAVLNWEKDLRTYAEWKFVYLPVQVPQNLAPR